MKYIRIKKNKKTKMPRYKFIAGCPACGSRDRYVWTHTNCSKTEEIDEDGWVYCLGCEKYLGFLMDLKYNCGHHDYKSAEDSIAIFQALTMLADFQKDVPVDFAKKISAKILKRLEQ